MVVSSEMHLACRVSATARLNCHSLADNAMYNQTFYKRTAIVFSGVDGSIHVLMPIQVGRKMLFCKSFYTYFSTGDGLSSTSAAWLANEFSSSCARTEPF